MTLIHFTEYSTKTSSLIQFRNMASSLDLPNFQIRAQSEKKNLNLMLFEKIKGALQ